MRTVSYKSVRDAVAARMGIDAAVNLLANQKAVLAEYITSAVRVGWEFFDWPEILLVEERTPVSGWIALDEAGETEIDQVAGVYWTDPTASAVARDVSFSLGDRGILITDPEWMSASSATVWVRFKAPPPRFTGTDYSSAVTYAAGELVYHEGECYEAAGTTAGNEPPNAIYWTLQALPYFLAEFVKLQAYAETLAEDGQVDKANYNFQRAEGLLVVAMDNVWLRQGQTRSWRN